MGGTYLPAALRAAALSRRASMSLSPSFISGQSDREVCMVNMLPFSKAFMNPAISIQPDREAILQYLSGFMRPILTAPKPPME